MKNRSSRGLRDRPATESCPSRDPSKPARPSTSANAISAGPVGPPGRAGDPAEERAARPHPHREGSSMPPRPSRPPGERRRPAHRTYRQHPRTEPTRATRRSPARYLRNLLMARTVPVVMYGDGPDPARIPRLPGPASRRAKTVLRYSSTPCPREGGGTDLPGPRRKPPPGRCSAGIRGLSRHTWSRENRGGRLGHFRSPRARGDLIVPRPLPLGQVVGGDRAVTGESGHPGRRRSGPRHAETSRSAAARRGNRAHPPESMDPRVEILVLNRNVEAARRASGGDPATLPSLPNEGCEP